MTAIAKWLLLNSKAGAIIGLVQALALAGALSAWGVAHLELKQARAANVAMAQDLGRANGQLSQLAADSDRRAKEALAAQARAHQEALAFQDAARRLASAKPAYPNDLCRSADALIRQEIATDHAK